jgi:hypothetical protein
VTKSKAANSFRARKKRVHPLELLFLSRAEIVPFSAGGPTERVQGAMPARKNVQAQTIGMNLSWIRLGRPRMPNCEAAEAVSYYAEDAGPSWWRFQRAPELLPRQERA